MTAGSWEPVSEMVIQTSAFVPQAAPLQFTGAAAAPQVAVKAYPGCAGSTYEAQSLGA